MTNDLKHHRQWIAAIIATALSNPITTKIQREHLKILVRWYPQIDQKGCDAYYSYLKCRRINATLAARRELLKCENFHFSKHAFLEIVESKEPSIYPEHNPPVKFITSKLEGLVRPSANQVLELFHENDYGVVILTNIERKRIIPPFNVSGTARERLEQAFETKDIKSRMASEIGIKKFLSK